MITRGLLLIFLLFITAPAQAGSDTWVMSQVEFRALGLAQQQKYLEAVFKVIAKREEASGRFFNCVYAGHVTVGNGTCKRPESFCPHNRYQCASYFGLSECQNLNSTYSLTKQCFDRIENKGEFLGFFKKDDAQPLWMELRTLVEEFCSAKLTAKLPSTECKALTAFRPNRQSKKTSTLFRLFFQPANASEKVCTYDEKTKTFFGRKGRKAYLDFKVHGIPSRVAAYQEESIKAERVKQAAIDLIQHHKHSLGELEQTYQEAKTGIKARTPTWVGFEQENYSLQMLGGGKGRHQRLANEKKRLELSGLSPKEVHDTLLVTRGALELAWFESVGARSPQIKVFGVDDYRDPRVDELDDGVNTAINQRYNHDFKKFKSHDNDEGNQAIIDVYNIMKAYADDEVEQSRRLTEYQKTDDFKRLPEASQTWVSEFQMSIDKYESFKQERADRSEREMVARDIGMGQSIWSNMVKEGDGSIILGTNHKEGTLASLKRECEKNTPAETYSPSKPSSTGVVR